MSPLHRGFRNLGKYRKEVLITLTGDIQLSMVRGLSSPAPHCLFTLLILEPIGNSALGQVVGGQLYLDSIAW
jgi:hypothetical protein